MFRIPHSLDSQLTEGAYAPAAALLPRNKIFLFLVIFSVRGAIAAGRVR
jgi:hypothetical protein